MERATQAGLSRVRRGRNLRRQAAGALLAALALGMASSAGCGEPPDELGLAPGTVLAGRGPALPILLEQLATLEGTPLARWATGLRTRLEGCEAFFAHWPPAEPDGPEPTRAEPTRAGRPWAERVGCVEESSAQGLAARALAELDDPQRAPSAWVLSRRAPSGSWRLRGRPLRAGGHQVAARLSASSFGADAAGMERWKLLLPAAAAAGPPRLAEGSLVHLRVRPDGGLDLASGIEAEGLADRLFALRNDLFLAATLAGAWELAVYLPREGQRIPPVALRLDAKDGERAVTAMEGFVAEVRGTWAVNRRPVTLAGRRGACLDDLNVMPELAPCYVLDDRVADQPGLVVGWNAESVELALRPRAAADPEAAASAVRVHLDRLPAADARLARSASGMGGAPAAPAVVYPWRTLTVDGLRDGSEYRLSARLDAGR